MRALFYLLTILPISVFAQPCSTTNASGCSCPDGSDTCYLLPDITISWQALRDYDNGPTEYSQTGNGAEDGRLRITGCTPNIGYGPFTVRGTDYFICGTDTYYNASGTFTCPNGETPTNLLRQRIYKKMGATMGYEDIWAGGQTYHPTHGHNHVDDWVSFTLRMEDPNEPDTLKWPIIGNGSKLGFCLMDYGSCDYYNGYCRDVQAYNRGTIKTSANIPNYGLGGGQYNCSPIEQGISVGYVDIYSETLDGMWINIPPNTCNGNYWIVAEVDPRNSFRESNENNNWTAIPVTLTRQLTTAVADISIDGTNSICSGDSLTLTANTALSYLWSNGDTTQSISIHHQGAYAVQITSQCGTDVSDTAYIEEINSSIIYFSEDTTCVSGSVDLFAAGTGSVKWYDAPAGGSVLDTGSVFTTPALTATTVYYAENITSFPGTVQFSEPHDHTGTSSFSQFHGYIIFDCLSEFILRSVKVYTDDAGARLIEWRNSNGDVLADTLVFIPAGTSRVMLNFQITPGADYQLGTNESINLANFGNITPNLRRTRNGLNYPYVIAGILSLNGSPYDSQFDQFYYYFYDWEIETGGGTCVSPRQPVTAVVTQPPAVTFTGLDTVYQVSDSPVTLNGTPAGGVFSGNGISGNMFDPFTAGVGLHTITYRYTDAAGCYNEYSLTTHVKKGQITASVVADDDEICFGESAVLTASGGTSYLWNTGDTTESITVTPPATAVYSVTVSDAFGSSDAADVIVTVNPLPVVEITGLDTLYRLSDAPVTMAGLPAGGIFSGAGVSGNIFDPFQAGVGFHVITYAYEDASGCRNETTFTVHVKQGPITASAGDDTEICAGSSVRLTASGGTIFEWSTGDTSESIDVSPAATTTYSVTVSDNSGSSDVAQVKVTVNPLPVVDFTGLEAEYETKDNPSLLTGTPPGGTFTGSGIISNTFYPTVAGIGGPYSITYSYTDTKGCSNSITKQVTVKASVGIPMTNSMNGKMIVYPNPANDVIYIEFLEPSHPVVQMRLLNALGARLMSKIISSEKGTAVVDLSSFSGGVYLLEIISPEISSVTRIIRK